MENSDAAKRGEPVWLDDVEEHNYPAAASYLNLIFHPDRVTEIVAKLRSAAIVQVKAKDIFRASQLSLLGVSNSHVENDRKKLEKKIGLSPILLVRDEALGKVIIADGYHRLCAIYQIHEDIWVHCKLV